MSDPQLSISSKVNRELLLVDDSAQREALRSLLVPPKSLRLNWDYGQENEQYDCWVVGQATDGNILLIYCEQGFGPTFPWGFIYPHTGSIGMDSQWHSGLIDATIVAGLLPAPEDYIVPGPRSGRG